MRQAAFATSSSAESTGISALCHLPPFQTFAIEVFALQDADVHEIDVTSTS